MIPSLNEREGIRLTLGRIPKEALVKQGHEVEVLVVDGQSTDGTADVARELGATVLVEPRLGYGRAYKTGFERARGDVIVTGDADASYPFEDAAEFLRLMEVGGYDFVTLDRFADMVPGSMSAKHKFGNWVLSTAGRVLFGVKVRDSQSGMWLLRRRVLETLPIESFSDKMPFSEELKIRAFRHPGLRSAELPGRYLPREGEAKLSSWKDGWRNLKHLFRLRFQRSPKGNGSA